MKVLQLLLEALRSVRYQPIAAALTLLVVALTCSATLLTVGRTAASQRDIAARLETAGSREITITDTATPARITPASAPNAVQPIAVAVMASATGVQKAVAYAAPFDVHNPRIGDGSSTVPAWMLVGQLDGIATVSGRLPLAGEAVISRHAANALGLVEGIGSIEAADGSTYPVVGTFDPVAPFTEFNAGTIIISNGTRPLATLRLLATSAVAASTVQSLALKLVRPIDSSTLRVTSPQQLAELQQSIGGDLTASGRGLLLLLLSVGAGLIASLTFADVLMRRTDLGRRRALGITRLDAISLIILRTFYPALVGAVLGCSSGLAMNYRSGWAIPLAFTLGVGTLAILAGIIAALGPAIFAASRDPVRVLRTP